MDSVNSTTFIKRPPYMTDTQEKFLYTKELLSGRIFLGSYLEKRYVTVLKEYRDVVFVNSEETDLKHDLDKIRKKWLGVQDFKWVGITGPDEFGFPKAHCLWVKLSNLAIGQYWFQIKHVKLVDQEIVFQLKCIRKSQAPLCAVTSELHRKATSEIKSIKSGASTSTASSSAANVSNLEPQKALSTIHESCIEAIHTIRPYLTFRNAITVVKVGCALMVVMAMGTVSLVSQVAEYFLKLVREFTLLVNAFTPIVVQMIDFLSKIVGGFFILIAAVMRGGNQPQRPQITYSQSLLDGGLNQPPVDWRERNRKLRQELLTPVRRK